MNTYPFILDVKLGYVVVLCWMSTSLSGVIDQLTKLGLQPVGAEHLTLAKKQGIFEQMAGSTVLVALGEVREEPEEHWGCRTFSAPAVSASAPVGSVVVEDTLMGWRLNSPNVVYLCHRI